MSFIVKRRRFSIEQITAALRQAEVGAPVADLVRQLGISESTFHRWTKAYGGQQLGAVVRESRPDGTADPAPKGGAATRTIERRRWRQ